MIVHLTYFKDTGKYNAEGEFPVDFCSFHTIVQRVDDMHRTGRLPGLMEGAGKGCYVLIQPPDENRVESEGVPHLLCPIEESRCDRCGDEDGEKRKMNGVLIGVLCTGCWRTTIREVYDTACIKKE